MQRWIVVGALVLIGALCLAGCDGGMGGRPPLTDHGVAIPPGCDPDGVEPCPDDWFICVEDDALNKYCEGQEPAVPDAGGGWECSVVDGSLVCVGDDMPSGGDGSWVCEDNEDGTVTCTRDAYVPGDGSGEGEWDCYYEGEFVVCEFGDYGGEENPDNPDNPPDNPPDIPDGGGDICFYAVDDPDGPPMVHGTYGFETVEGRYAVHVRLIFNEAFVDNTYGINSNGGYRSGVGGHRFNDLVTSDHAEVGFIDGDGNEVLKAKFDYISVSDTEESGYDNLGVTGGDGAMLSGDASAVVATTSSLDRNFNELGCVYTVDSPVEGECPGWDYRVIYEMWIAADAFGSAGFRRPNMTFVHASPSRMDDTVYIEPGDCPDW